MDFSTFAERHVVLFDGGMGTQIQGRDLSVDGDYWGQENCSEILNLSRPDLIETIHRDYFTAGSDAVETNTFGGSPITLAEFDLGPKAHEINETAVRLARQAAAGLAGPRFVVGSIGPGTKLPSLGHISYREVEEGIFVQTGGLLAGGVDALLIETCQDPLQVKAAINGARRAMDGRSQIPVMVQVTIETTGTMLVGTDIDAATTIISSMGVDGFGLNCATGPKEMVEHLRHISKAWPGLITVQPNAGLPELRDGQTWYPLEPKDLADWLKRFVTEFGVGAIGGCCGTGTEHIKALDTMLKSLATDGHRPAPIAREAQDEPKLASLFSAQPFRQENTFLAIGERCNANGSKRFREFQEAGNWDACVAMGREQVGEGAHTLDLCTAFVGRDEVAELVEVTSRMRGQVDAPIVFDSTELPVLEAGLELYGGKGVINSINFEDGEDAPTKRMELSRLHGAAVIALTIDEVGMAKTAEDKLRIAERLVDFACTRHGLPQSDLMIDPLTFTICTGNEDDRKLGIWTLDAIETIAQRFPDIQIILGLSNISFGLNAAARHVLNSVMLDHAQRRGLTGAIVHPSKILPLHSIPAEEVEAAENLIFDRWIDDTTPLQHYMAMFVDRKAAAAVKKVRPDTIEEVLAQRIVDGDKQGLEDDLAEALKTIEPLTIINQHLLAGMKVVGELFGAGKMQLPFVLQSAETMKKSVAYLEPFMEKADGSTKGTIVLATVKGDVHDIGKNLVDIILTNNGYRCINLGIKQPLNTILEATREHNADAIGMSGLLVKSTVIMRENLEELGREDIKTPVILGGAALTRAYVEDDCAKAYSTGQVAYARDAFDGLKLMDLISNKQFDAHIADRQVQAAGKKRPTRKPRTLEALEETAIVRPVDAEETRLRRTELSRDIATPEPPFWGTRVIDNIDVRALVPYLNDNMLYQFHWGYKKNGRKLEDFLNWAQKELRPILVDLLDETREIECFEPKASYGYYKAAGEKNDLVLFDESGNQELCRFTLPRQDKPDGLCVADFVRDIDDETRDVIGMQVVTVGQKASEIARDWFAKDRYNDYVRLHGLGVELAEALAEFIHTRIRTELGIHNHDAEDRRELLRQGYRGSRYSFGYPACPRLMDQVPMLDLLEASRIGIELSDGWQLHPEQSTSAIVLHHPQARYFNV